MKIEGDNNSSLEVNSVFDSAVKSITSDLALLGNALMTRINDPLTILEFISFDSLPKEELKHQLKSLIEQINSCDNDDDRLKFLLEIHFSLASERFKSNGKLKSVLAKLENLLLTAKNHRGNDLKKSVSKFQVEVLQVVPGITPNEYKELCQDLLELEKAIDLNSSINAVYEKINSHTQIPFDE